MYKKHILKSEKHLTVIDGINLESIDRDSYQLYKLLSLINGAIKYNKSLSIKYLLFIT